VCFQDKNDPPRSQDGNQGRVVEGSEHGVRINFSFGYFRAVQAQPLQSLNAQLGNTVDGSLGACDRPLRVLSTSYESISLRYFQGAVRYCARNIRRPIKINSSYFDTITR
jgi:hypothetical protein